MNTQYFRSGSFIAEIASGKRAFIKLPSATTVETGEMLSGKKAVTEILNLASALFVNWVILALVIGLCIALAN